jgi:hypothetical protein
MAELSPRVVVDSKRKKKNSDSMQHGCENVWNNGNSGRILKKDERYYREAKRLQAEERPKCTIWGSFTGSV